MGFLRRNRDALALEVIGAVLLGGAVAGALFVLDQSREDERYQNATALSQQQFDRAQQLSNEQYAREVSAANSGDYSFSRIDLRGTTLSGLQLTNCPDTDPAYDGGPVCTNFFEADLSRSILDGANLRGAFLRLANLSEASLTSTKLRGSSGTGASFHCASARNADFSSAQLQASNFTDSSLQDSSFNNADLTGADFSNANLSSADFSGAELASVSFDGAYYIEGKPPTGLPDDILKGLIAEDTYRDNC